MERKCAYCGSSGVPMYSGVMCRSCANARTNAKRAGPKRDGMAKNSIWDADRFFRERFMVLYKQAARKAAKIAPDACYIWEFKLNSQGYGEWKWYDRISKKQYGSGAHRISLELFLERPLRERMVAGHRCPRHNWVDDHPDRRCFRQDHLGEITQSENMLDWAEDYYRGNAVNDSGA